MEQAAGLDGSSLALPPSTYGTATYTFDKLLPGTYDLQATWTGGASRTSGAVYSWEIETAADAPQKVSLVGVEAG